MEWHTHTKITSVLKLAKFDKSVAMSVARIFAKSVAELHLDLPIGKFCCQTLSLSLYMLPTIHLL